MMSELLLSVLLFLGWLLCYRLARYFFKRRKDRADEIPSSSVAAHKPLSQDSLRAETRGADPAPDIDLNDKPHTEGVFLPIPRENGANALLMLLNYIPCHVFIKDPRKNFQYIIANSNFLDYYQLRESEVIGHYDADIFDRDIAGQIRDQDVEVCANPGKVIRYYEDTIYQLNGKAILETLKVCFQTDSGHQYILGISVDVTQLRNKADRLQKTQDFLNLVINSLPILIFAKDADNDFRYSIVNESFTRYFGINAQDIIGKTDDAIIADPELCKQTLREDREVMTKNTQLESSKDPIDSHGIQHHLRTLKVAATAPDGNRILLGAATDLTELTKILRNERANGDVLAKAVVENNFSVLIDTIFELSFRIFPLDRMLLLLIDGDEINLYREKNSSHNCSIYEIGMENYQRLWQALLKRFNLNQNTIQGDLRDIPAMEEFFKKFPDYPVRSFGAHAIYNEGKIVGILVGTYHFHYKFEEVNTVLIRSMCNIISMLIVREQQNQTIRKEREQNQAILDSVDIPLWLYDRNGKVIQSNRAGNDLAPFEKLNEAPYACREFFKCDMSEEDCLVHRACSTGLAQRKLMSYGGCQYLVGARPLFDSNGNVSYVTESFSDVTELIEREENEKLLKRCLASVMPGPDFKNVLKRINQYLCEHFHGDRSYIIHLDVENDRIGSIEEFCSRGFEPILSRFTGQPFDKDARWFKRMNEYNWIDCDIEAAIKSTNTLSDWGVWEKCIRQSGTKRFYVMPIFLHGKLWGNWGMSFVNENISLGERSLQLIISIGRMLELVLLRQEYIAKLAEALERAEAATRAKSVFFAAVNHELRTPLTSIIGYSSLLSETNVPPKDLIEYATRINVSSKVLLSLINDILDFSKLEADQIKIVLASTDLVVMFRELYAIFHQAAAAKGIELAFHIQPEMPLLGLDDLRVRQILMNLVNNAIKYTETGSITFSADYDAQGTLSLTVTDTGIGIEPELQQRIFEPFIQLADGCEARKFKGIGLGLPIVKSLTEKMGGSIVLDSEVGCGSTFRITLPRVNVFDLSAPVTAEDGEQPIDTALHVLLVDDFSKSRSLFEIMLNKLNITSIYKAASSPEALAILEKHPIDILFIDMSIANTDGLALAETLRADKRFESIRIYAVTADVDAWLSLTESLFSGVLLKPITLKELKKIISKTADEHR